MHIFFLLFTIDVLVSNIFNCISLVLFEFSKWNKYFFSNTKCSRSGSRIADRTRPQGLELSIMAGLLLRRFPHLDRTARLHGTGLLHSVTGPSTSRLRARQGSAAQVPDSAKDDGSLSQQGGMTRQRMTSQRLWTTQQAWLTQHMMMTTQQAFAVPAHDVEDPAHAPEQVLQLPAKRLGDGSSKSERAMTTQEVRGFQRVCGGTAQLRRVRTPQIKKWVSQARGDEPVVQATPAGNTPAAR